MGNRCCTWCARVCCCSSCCQEAQPLLEGKRRQSEEPILTVVQDPTDNSEIQEMKFKLDSDDTSEDWEEPPTARGGVGRTEAKDSAPNSPQSKDSSEKVTSPHSRTFVRGGTGKASWRLTPTPKPPEGDARERDSDTVTMTFQESQGKQPEPRNFVLLSQELEGAELGEMQVSKSFTISSQGIMEN